MTELTLEQGEALEKIHKFLKDPDEPYFVLAGYAGTGKTYCMKHLARSLQGRLVFTAPTNKATKVLRDVLTEPSYKPECRTIYSLLGLRMAANGEVKELTEPEDPIDLGKFKAVVVDEGSMVSRALMRYIEKTVTEQKVKFIFLGDPAQLPPVGEAASPIWKSGLLGAELQKIMRHDNQILTFVTEVRKAVNQLVPRLKIASDNKDGEGVWRLEGKEMLKIISEQAALGRFSKPGQAKAIAWRNTTVDRLNNFIRRELFDSSAEFRFLPEDRITLTAPANSLDDNANLLATTDDEGTVSHIDIAMHPIWKEFKVYRLRTVLDDNSVVDLRVLHEDSEKAAQLKEAQLASAARADPKLWKDFWGFKEAFHSVKHSYAITAHRSQGSTYETAIVDWKDILANPNRSEAYRCLYVACSRPKKQLFLG